MRKDGAPRLVATLRAADDGVLELVSPVVGYYRDARMLGELVGGGARIGAIDVLGESLPIEAPDGAAGRVLDATRAARRPVAYGDVLLRLDPSGLEESAGAQSASARDHAADDVFRSPMAGRFYARPAPGKPAFVELGAEVEAGRTVALIEIMKTFNRLAYGGGQLPPRCRVVELLVSDGDDIEAGQALFRYEPA